MRLGTQNNRNDSPETEREVEERSPALGRQVSTGTDYANRLKDGSMRL